MFGKLWITGFYICSTGNVRLAYASMICITYSIYTANTLKVDWAIRQCPRAQRVLNSM